MTIRKPEAETRTPFRRASLRRARAQRGERLDRASQLDFYLFPTCIYLTLAVLRRFTYQQDQLLCSFSVLSSLCCDLRVLRSLRSAEKADRVCHLLRDVVFMACVRDFLCNTLQRGKMANFCCIQVQSPDPDVKLLKNSGSSGLLLVWLSKGKSQIMTSDGGFLISAPESLRNSWEAKNIPKPWPPTV